MTGAHPPFVSSIRPVPVLNAVICGVITALGAIATCGWLLHSPTMIALVPGGFPMVFDTGMGFLLAGIALWLLHKPGDAARVARTSIGVVLVLLGSAVIAEALLDRSIGIDLPTLHTWYDYGNARPGRMAPNTAISFALIGASVLLIERAATKTQAVMVGMLTACILVLGLTGLASYTLAPHLLFEWARAGRMAIHTATGMILCGIALWMIWSKSEWYASKQYFREDEQLRLLGPGILMVVTMTAGLSGFVWQQNALQTLFANKFDAMRKDRVVLFTTTIEHARQHSVLAGRNARLEEAGRAFLSATTGAHSDTLSTTVAAALASSSSLRGIAIENSNGVVTGRFGDPSSAPAMAAPLNREGSLVLLWDGDLILRIRLPLRQDGGLLGTLVADQSLAYMAGPLFDTGSLGQSGELFVCALQQGRLICLPDSHHAKPWTVALPMGRDLPLPMQLALAGQQGHEIAVDYRGKNVLATYGQLTPELGIVIKQDTLELFAVIRHALLFAVPFIIGMALLGAVILYSQITPLVARILASESRAKERELQIRAVVGSVGEGILTIDEQGLICEANPAACEIFGYEAPELVGNSADIMLLPKNRKPHYGSVNQDLDGWVAGIAGRRNVKVSGRRKDGAEFPLELTINETTFGGGRMFVGVLRDITERDATERRLTILGQYDSLTGLPNRLLFMDRLNLAILRTQRTRSAVALLFLDLDGFKKINDTFGHQGGDELLVQFAKRLSATVRKTDTVARLAGDEFTILLEGLLEPTSGVVTLAEKIVATMQEPFSVAGRAIKVTASVGVAIQQSGDLQSADLLARADQAMYTAKRAGRNRLSMA